MSSYIRPAAEIQAEITEYKSKLAAAKETLDAIIGTANDHNSFNDSEGSQSLTKRSPEEQENAIEWLEGKIKKLYDELYGRSTRITHINRRSISDGGYSVRGQNL